MNGALGLEEAGGFLTLAEVRGFLGLAEAGGFLGLAEAGGFLYHIGGWRLPGPRGGSLRPRVDLKRPALGGVRGRPGRSGRR